MSVQGLGKCAKCFKQIRDATEVRTLMMPDKRAHMVHKDCHPDFKTAPHPEQLPGFTPSVDVVITPQEKIPTGSNYISTTSEEPSMPTREQTGSRRRTKKFL